MLRVPRRSCFWPRRPALPAIPGRPWALAGAANPISCKRFAHHSLCWLPFLSPRLRHSSGA
eukprot:4080889-Pyramimonas_sp.AAC.1